MDESILRALMRLFAIIANVNRSTGVSSSARTIVESYLNLQLNKDQVPEYLALYDEFLAYHHRNIKSTESQEGRKRNALNSVKVLKICQQINETLQQKDKVIVLLRLLEYINEEGSVSEKEFDFVDTVADTFNVSAEEYANMKSFVLGGKDEIPHKKHVLIYSSRPVPEGWEGRNWLHTDNLSGHIVFLHIPSTNTFIFRFDGEENLYLSGHHILPRRSYVLDQGAIIRSPRIKPLYYSNIAGHFFQAEGAAGVVLTARDVEFRFKNSENGIQRFNFSEDSGQLVGIMGGSGVGKSTLLNVLNGNLPLNAGTITINGFDIHRDREKLEGVVGFVPQDDLLIEELTVFQNLYYNAKLCFRDFTHKQIIKRVIKMLIDLDLNEVKHLKVGNPLNKFISGGQRKRLNIALELIREPSVLFVDEPTSGLSSMDSETVMLLLREQALKGRLVIVNIHQPSSDIYKLFDKLMILDKGGRVIYYGNPIDAVTYFKSATNHVRAEESECPACGNVNPEQVLQIVEEKVVNEHGKFTRSRKVSPQQWYEMYQETMEKDFVEKPSPGTVPSTQFKIPGPRKQFRIFTIRNVLSKLANTQYLVINFLEAPLLAIIIAYFSKHISGTADDPGLYIFSENANIPGFIFMCVIFALFVGMTVSAEEIIKDRKILQRESFLNLSWMSYIHSKIAVLLIISAIQTITFVLLANPILHVKGLYFSYWLILFSAAFCANMIGLNISSALDSVISIYILIPFLLVPQLLLSGVIISFDKLHPAMRSEQYVPFVGDVMVSRWANEALLVQQFKGNRYQKELFPDEMDVSNYSFKASFLVPAIELQLSEAWNLKRKNEKPAQVSRKMAIVRNEIRGLDEEIQTKGWKTFPWPDSLTDASLSPQVVSMTNKHLEAMKNYFNRKYKKAVERRDKTYALLTKTVGGKDVLQRMKQDYHNEKVEEIVKNFAEVNKLEYGTTKIIQKKDPVFYFPTNTWGRAHLYAPAKRVGNVYIDTFWFNVGVIWIMALFFYVLLAFDVLRKIVARAGQVSKQLTARFEKSGR